MVIYVSLMNRSVVAHCNWSIAISMWYRGKLRVSPMSSCLNCSIDVWRICHDRYRCCVLSEDSFMRHESQSLQRSLQNILDIASGSICQSLSADRVDTEKRVRKAETIVEATRSSRDHCHDDDTNQNDAVSCSLHISSTHPNSLCSRTSHPVLQAGHSTTTEAHQPENTLRICEFC